MLSRSLCDGVSRSLCDEVKLLYTGVKVHLDDWLHANKQHSCIVFIGLVLNLLAGFRSI